MSTPAQTKASYDEILGAPDLASLRKLYGERGLEGPEAEFYQRLHADWREACLEEAKAITESPPALEPEVVEAGGIRYSIYGVVHGLLGGHDREYKDFVDSALRQLEHVIIENALRMFYPTDESVPLPDFVVMGIGGSLAVGLFVGVYFPLLIFEGLREVFKARPKSADSFEFSPRYHAVDVETRRGLDEDPVLPSRLQIEMELKMWEQAGIFATWKAGAAIVPRSMFMAGFAEGFARTRERKDVNLVVGDLHTAEIKHFLENPPDHAIFRWGQTFGARSNASRVFAHLCAKVMHLGLASVGGGLVLIPAIAGVFFLINWARG